MSNTDTEAQATEGFRWPSDTPTKNISILDEEFTVPQPYKEGHTISAIEAKVLNQTFAENIGNNQRAAVKKAQEGGEGAPSIEEVRDAFNDYAWGYQFTMAGAGGGSRSLTPVEKEARQLARTHIMAQLAAQGRKRKEIDDEKFEAEVARIASLDKIVKLAEKNVKQRQKDLDQVASLLANEEQAAA